VTVTTLVISDAHEGIKGAIAKTGSERRADRAGRIID
jgi:hypothetical protein